VRVAGEHFSGFSPFLIWLIVLLGVKFPFDQSLITRTRQKELNLLVSDLFLTNSKGGNPAAMAFEVTLVLELVLLCLLFFH